MNAPGALVRYDAMVHAIAECHRVDEVKDLHDKARALEIYAKQAMNVDAERKACEIRLRAERKAGELMKAMQRLTPAEKGAKGAAKQGKKVAATASATSKYREAIDSAGINERTARRWQELAEVPKKDFEDALRDPEKKPTTTSILDSVKAANGAPRMDDDALAVWGVICDFDSDNYGKRKPKALYDGMTETMQKDVRRIIPKMIRWLTGLQEISQLPKSRH